MFGRLKCKECGQSFQSPINSKLSIKPPGLVVAHLEDLSLAVDVYSEYVTFVD
jgi:transcription elongation factor Elf1